MQLHRRLFFPMVNWFHTSLRTAEDVLPLRTYQALDCQDSKMLFGVQEEYETSEPFKNPIWDHMNPANLEVLSSGFPYYLTIRYGGFWAPRFRKLASWQTDRLILPGNNTNKPQNSMNLSIIIWDQVTEMLPRAKSMHPSSSNISM